MKGRRCCETQVLYFAFSKLTIFGIEPSSTVLKPRGHEPLSFAEGSRLALGRRRQAGPSPDTSFICCIFKTHDFRNRTGASCAAAQCSNRAGTSRSLLRKGSVIRLVGDDKLVCHQAQVFYFAFSKITIFGIEPGQAVQQHGVQTARARASLFCGRVPLFAW